MPKSKYRKKKQLKKSRSFGSNEIPRPVTRIRIRRHRFAELRSDPDFLALIKIGRAVNAVISGTRFISDYINDETPAGRRQYYRAFFTTCGYLYEGLLLVENLRSKYFKEPFFVNLNALIGDKYSKHREILKTIRDSVAFHLDWQDKTTKPTLSDLKLSRYDLMSSTSDRAIDFYFDLADTIDLNYIIDTFKDDRPEKEVLAELIELITEVMRAFNKAGHEFLTGLGNKMNFSDYID